GLERTESRPWDDLVRAAARLVLLLPLLPAADLQVARIGDPGDGRHPDDLADHPAGTAVRRPADGAAALAATGRGRGGRSRRDLDGGPHLQGRDREGGDRGRGEGSGPELGEEGGLRWQQG